MPLSTVCCWARCRHWGGDVVEGDVVDLCLMNPAANKLSSSAICSAAIAAIFRLENSPRRKILIAEKTKWIHVACAAFNEKKYKVA